ncbi:restriction endonuclease [Legionella pneumophila serogroup 1]|nr:restriction endonuclease [Legionella pneumophila]HDO9973315.1 restriction endonuclease [Legionella pneumophila]
MRIRFPRYSLADILTERLAFKAGLLLSMTEILNHLNSSSEREIIESSEKHLIVLRAEDFEQLYLTLLKNTGYLHEDYEPDPAGIAIYHKYKDTSLEPVVQGVLKILTTSMRTCVENALKKEVKEWDPKPLFIESLKQFGKDGVTVLSEFLACQHAYQMLSFDTNLRYDDWSSTVSLSDLFLSQKNNSESNKFFDQRYIDYLYKNYSSIEKIHWRKFEELTAEYFQSQGFKVEIGPGSNDDGVDIRVWSPDDFSEQGIIQCKRVKDKIEKSIVKSLYADVLYNNAMYGLIVTTSELSPGSRSVISQRGYPIQEINKVNLLKWLNDLKTPGRGISRK